MNKNKDSGFKYSTALKLPKCRKLKYKSLIFRFISPQKLQPFANGIQRWCPKKFSDQNSFKGSIIDFL